LSFRAAESKAAASLPDARLPHSIGRSGKCDRFGRISEAFEIKWYLMECTRQKQIRRETVGGKGEEQIPACRQAWLRPLRRAQNDNETVAADSEMTAQGRELLTEVIKRE
jgi:hypothetical protein